MCGRIVAGVLVGFELRYRALQVGSRTEADDMKRASVVGTRSVTQALRYLTSPSLMIRNWMKLMSGASGLPFSGTPVTHSYSRAFAAVDGMVAVEQVAAAQAVDILEEGFMVTLFGDQQEREASCGQLLDKGLLGVKAVGDDNCHHPGIVGAEPPEHPVAGRDFAILLIVLAAFAVVCPLGNDLSRVYSTLTHRESLKGASTIILPPLQDLAWRNSTRFIVALSMARRTRRRSGKRSA